MKLALIAAMTDKRVIGAGNKLPWHLPEDLKRFKAITLGHPIIMGRKTYESLGRPLPGRTNIVVSRNPQFAVAAGVHRVASLEAAMEAARRSEKASDTAFVIGGGELFTQALPLAESLYLTLIHQDFAGDAHFPEFDLKHGWQLSESQRQRSSGTPPFDYSYLTAHRS